MLPILYVYVDGDKIIIQKTIGFSSNFEIAFEPLKKSRWNFKTKFQEKTSQKRFLFFKSKKFRYCSLKHICILMCAIFFNIFFSCWVENPISVSCWAIKLNVGLNETI